MRIALYSGRQSRQNKIESKINMSNEDTVLATENGFTYVEKTFNQGVEAGLKYAVPQATTVQAAVDRYGADLLLTLINQGLTVRIGQKVKSQKIPKGDTEEAVAKNLQALLASNPDGLIFSVDEAKAYRPGVRGPGFTATLDEALAKIAKGELSETEAMKILLSLQSKKRKKTV